MARLQVTCINKTNRTSAHERISHIGGAGWRHTAADAIYNIDKGINTYYVKVGVYETEVITAFHNGNEYLKTKSDTTLTDNLLSLNECV